MWKTGVFGPNIRSQLETHTEYKNTLIRLVLNGYNTCWIFSSHLGPKRAVISRLMHSNTSKMGFLDQNIRSQMPLLFGFRRKFFPQASHSHMWKTVNSYCQIFITNDTSIQVENHPFFNSHSFQVVGGGSFGVNYWVPNGTSVWVQ